MGKINEIKYKMEYIEKCHCWKVLSGLIKILGVY